MSFFSEFWAGFVWGVMTLILCFGVAFLLILWSACRSAPSQEEYASHDS